MDTPKPLLSVKDVSVSYRLRKGLRRHKEFWALKDISFDLQPGEALGIVGRNGVGKSTLLRVLAGVMSPTSGTIERNVDSISLLALNVGFINNLSGRENAILGGIFLGRRRKDMLGELDAIAEFSELGEFFDQPIHTYSSGMRARLGFAVALQINPQILLVDEVTAVGDVAFRSKSYEAMEEKMQGNHGMIFVSHHPASVRRLCSRVLWIEHGEIKMSGSVKEVLPTYRKAVDPARSAGDQS